MSKYTPPGWVALDFEGYILECAIRDRQTLIDCYRPVADRNEDENDYIEEVEEEIRCMRERLARVERKRYGAS